MHASSVRSDSSVALNQPAVAGHSRAARLCRPWVQSSQAVVTGRRSGIGAATARRLAAEGFEVVCAPAARTGSRRWPTEIGGTPVACDVTDDGGRGSAGRGRSASARRPRQQRRRRLRRLTGRRGRRRAVAPDVRRQRDRPDAGDPGAAPRAGRAAAPASSSTSARSPGGWPTRAAAATPRPSTAPRWSPRPSGSSSSTSRCGCARWRPGMVRTEEFALVRFGGDRAQGRRGLRRRARPADRRRRRRRDRLGRHPPPHVNIDELVIRPRAQAAPHKVHRLPTA